jgi:hypothetical protein
MDTGPIFGRLVHPRLYLMNERFAAQALRG